ncbi:MAG: DNA repair protein RecO [Alphaproteobacteria bacterium]|nr:DNA repair protein RecO [Alphaproteobacteria bacterium]
MQWSDRGIVLSARKHGETSAILHVLTQHHGRHAGLVRGGASRTRRGLLQPGNELGLIWRARLAEHLGTFTVELTQARAAAVLHDAARLAAVAAACEVVDSALPERAPDVAGYRAFRTLLESIEGDDDWPVAYARWEFALLASLGFGLDPATEGLPAFLGGQAAPSDARGRAAAVRAGLDLTGRHLPGALADHKTRLPARARLVERLARAPT